MFQFNTPQVKWYTHCAIVFVFLLCLTGCDWVLSTASRVSESERKNTDQVAWLDEVVVTDVGRLLARNCKLFEVLDDPSEGTQLRVLFTPAIRPLSTCRGSSVVQDGEFVVFRLGRQSFGAGAAVWERFRMDGTGLWQEEIGITWINHEKYEAWRNVGSKSDKADSVKKVVE